jgi:hypothetical protein
MFAFQKQSLKLKTIRELLYGSVCGMYLHFFHSADVFLIIIAFFLLNKYIHAGSDIKAYGTESQNRAARQRIPHRIYNDSEGKEHVQLQFQARGPSGRATVHADMYQSDGEWRYHFLYLTVESPLPQQVVLIRPNQPDQ